MRITTRFPLGRIVGIAGALRTLEAASVHPLVLLKGHAHGDWGDPHPDDDRANLLALRQGLCILGAHMLPTTERVWIITEVDRSTTAILLPEEY